MVFRPRADFFHTFSPKEILVRRWNGQSAAFEKVDQLTEENLQMEENLKNLDTNFGPYPFETYKKWCGLSSNLNSADIVRLLPDCGFIDSVCDYVPKTDDQNRSELDKDGVPILKIRQESKIKFSEVSRGQWWPSDCTDRERSLHAQNSNWLLNKLLHEHTINGILAEFQFAYITFVIGQVMNSFDQWKQLLRVFCFCKDISSHEVFFTKFLSSLYFQMTTIPEDFMVDIVSSNNVVLDCLNNFFRNLADDEDVSEALKSKAFKFRSFCEKRFEWAFYSQSDSEEDEEDAPVIVTL